MHFSKTYSELLLTLPPELRENAIQYRQLKKLINNVVNELASLGLNHAVLNELLVQEDQRRPISQGREKEREQTERHNTSQDLSRQPDDQPKLIYELSNDSHGIEPRLRFLVVRRDGENTSLELGCGTDLASSQHPNEEPSQFVFPLSRVSSQRIPSERSLLWTLQSRSYPLRGEQSREGLSYHPKGQTNECLNMMVHHDAGTAAVGAQEFIVPLASDTAFFRLLLTALRSLSDRLQKIHRDFIEALQNLSQSISLTARPASSTSAFRPLSPSSSDYRYMSLSSIASSVLSIGSKSDLNSWREIFQLYVETEIFESITEANRGERTLDESERRLTAFAERMTRRGLSDGRKLKLKESRKALEDFLELNLFILNLKKFQYATAEATRKILKKHTKRTALPLPPMDSSIDAVVVPRIVTSLPHILVQAIGETLLPIIPSLDDYSCLICMSIAFKPVRLFCGHLFCVRCLVKMQKRGQADCPMCRAPTVLKANRSNVDWALLNFMQDWFPIESRTKRKANEREAAEEELREMGIDPNGCAVM